MANTPLEASHSTFHDTPSVLNIQVSKIYVRPQYRQNFDHVTELADDIQKNGLQQPIVVFKSRNVEGYSFELIAGESRLRAYQLLGRTKIAASLRAAPSDDLERVTLQLSENIQRSDLTQMEIALAAEDLRSTYSLERAQVAALLKVSVRATARFRAINSAMENHPDIRPLLMRLNIPGISALQLTELATLATLHMELADLVTRELAADTSALSASRIAQLIAAVKDCPEQTQALLAQLDTETLDPSPTLALLRGIERIKSASDPEELESPELPEKPEPAAPPKAKPSRAGKPKTMKRSTYRATEALYQGKTGQVSSVIFIDEQGERHELPLEQVELGLEEVSE